MFQTQKQEILPSKRISPHKKNEYHGSILKPHQYLSMLKTYYELCRINGSIICLTTSMNTTLPSINKTLSKTVNICINTLAGIECMNNTAPVGFKLRASDMIKINYKQQNSSQIVLPIHVVLSLCFMQGNHENLRKKETSLHTKGSSK